MFGRFKLTQMIILLFKANFLNLQHKPRGGISGTSSPSPEVNNGASQFPSKRPSFPTLYPAAPVGTPEPPPTVTVPTLEPPVAAVGNERPPAPPSEETSFTQLPSENGALDKDERKTRRRGMVETV
jgi:hypothetical protein